MRIHSRLFHESTYPTLTSLWVSSDLLLIGGGGGAQKTGRANLVELFRMHPGSTQECDSLSLGGEHAIHLLPIVTSDDHAVCITSGRILVLRISHDFKLLLVSEKHISQVDRGYHVTASCAVVGGCFFALSNDSTKKHVIQFAPITMAESMSAATLSTAGEHHQPAENACATAGQSPYSVEELSPNGLEKACEILHAPIVSLADHETRVWHKSDETEYFTTNHDLLCADKLGNAFVFRPEMTYLLAKQSAPDANTPESLVLDVCIQETSGVVYASDKPLTIPGKAAPEALRALLPFLTVKSAGSSVTDFGNLLTRYLGLFTSKNSCSLCILSDRFEVLKIKPLSRRFSAGLLRFSADTYRAYTVLSNGSVGILSVPSLERIGRYKSHFDGFVTDYKTSEGDIRICTVSPDGFETLSASMEQGVAMTIAVNMLFIALLVLLVAMTIRIRHMNTLQLSKTETLSFDYAV